MNTNRRLEQAKLELVHAKTALAGELERVADSELQTLQGRAGAVHELASEMTMQLGDEVMRRAVARRGELAKSQRRQAMLKQMTSGNPQASDEARNWLRQHPEE